MKAGLRWLMRHGRQPWAIAVLAAVAAFDSLVPMVPAEVLAVALFILQPTRIRLVFAVFAGAAAVSALLLSLAVSGASELASQAGNAAGLAGIISGPGWDQAKALVQAWGAPVLALSALFPDSPRTSIAVAALAGLPPLEITAWILVGKLVLYGVLAWGVVRLPQWSRGARWGQGPVGTRLPRMNRRLLALRRLLSMPPSALALPVLTLAVALAAVSPEAVAQPRTETAQRVTAILTGEDNARITVIDELSADGSIDRQFLRDAKVLYRSRVQFEGTQMVVRITEGHPSQRGAFRLAGSQLSVTDAQGQPLWSETLSRPLCLPEFNPEFVQAHWDRLAPGAPALPCVVPIIKARKVAPVQWVRLPDGPAGERVVELQPGSFGMRFFLKPTRLGFSADGRTLLWQTGQFESVKDPQASPSYLKGQARYERPREAQRWPVQRFGPVAATP